MYREMGMGLWLMQAERGVRCSLAFVSWPVRR